MSVVDLRRMRKHIISAKARLSKQYPQVRQQVEEIISVTEDSEKFYSLTDSVSCKTKQFYDI